MPTTAQITLSANMQSILGAGQNGYMRITLCGFGPILPAVPGVAMLVDAGVPQTVGPGGSSSPLTQLLWGNDVISPASTFYEVAILDQNRNVIQCGNYTFTGSGTIDLSSAPQIVPPYGFPLTVLRYAHCTGAIPGTVYTAPGPVIAVTYNGILMVPGQAPPTKSYTLSGNVITLNFSTSVGDRGIDAFCLA